MKFTRWTPPLLLLIVLVLCILMLSYPQASWIAGTRGLSIWWNVLFPSLFPFFVISEVMLGFGIVHFLGKLLDPLMKPLFRIPGSGGFVAAMGFASGYPVSAKLATKLREQGLVSRVEGERLVAFTTSSDPIFLIGAVSVGFFSDPKLAGILAVAHYGSAIFVGICLRFYGGSNETPQQTMKQKFDKSNAKSDARSFSLRAAVKAMHDARVADGRSLGELLQQAITSSLQLMAVVGGLVVFFSVILEVLTVSNAMSILYHGIRLLLHVLSLPPELAEPFVGGLFEVTLGAKAAAAPAGVPLVFKAAAAAFILSWGGLSVHAQVASILNGADLRYLPFLFARIFHSVVSTIFVFLLWEPLGIHLPAFIPSFLMTRSDSAWSMWPDLLTVSLIIISSMLIVSLLIRIIHLMIFRR
ncbi:sporulation integral membrane protein YlbJ [Fontibacillus solani]|uniref:Sporulation integral membrane protein YlbJ n=1 Tax=Fontibacillus solani TaxID=1572857 RepID=A0A7W3XSZ6_9BACL|nr:sporulation integral membrane protein YlbJ [Fontibacillus solani]MBA9087079.1 sporulation integral membrane protein YlbJ [Fontibacillus solani]